MKNYAPLALADKQKLLERKRWADLLQARGTDRAPGTPTAVTITAGTGTVRLRWMPPPDPRGTIKGWRIYQDDESNLLLTIRDPGQTAVILIPGDTKTHNYFVSAMNAQERESAKIRVPGKAL